MFKSGCLRKLLHFCYIYYMTIIFALIVFLIQIYNPVWHYNKVVTNKMVILVTIKKWFQNFNW